MLHDLTARDALYDPGLPDDLRPPSSAGVWTRAREDYQAGESATVVCERYGITRSVFFKRAKEDGWRKSDTPAAEPDGGVGEMEAALVADMLLRPATPAYALARRAWALAEVALHRRRRLEAMSWVRVAKELRKLAMEEANLCNWARTVKVCEEAAATAKAEAKAIREPDDDSTCEARVSEGSSAIPDISGGGDQAGEGGDENECVRGELAALSPASPPPPQERVPSPADSGEAIRPHRDDPLPLSIAANPKKLRAYIKAEFGWPRDPVDSADQSTRTADSPSGARGKEDSVQ